MAELRADRKIRIELTAPFEGWWAEMRLHVPFNIGVQLESDKPADKIAAIRSLIVAHNLRSEVGIDEVLDDPTHAPEDAIEQLVQKWTALKSALPNG
jgi:hypothetical protein